MLKLKKTNQVQAKQHRVLLKVELEVNKRDKQIETIEIILRNVPNERLKAKSIKKVINVEKGYSKIKIAKWYIKVKSSITETRIANSHLKANSIEELNNKAKGSYVTDKSSKMVAKS